MEEQALTARLGIAPLKLGDHLALDFLNSIAFSQAEGQRVEWLANGAALLNWLESQAVIDSTQRKSILENNPMAKLDECASQARRLREFFRNLLMRVKGKGARSVSENELEPLNSVLSSIALVPQLRQNKERRLELEWASDRRFSVGTLLTPIARSMAELLSETDLSLVSECESATCSLWFYDRTKSHHRRWCSQAVCGNRAKAAAFRERRKAAKT